MGVEITSTKEFRTVMDRIFAMMSEDPEMGPKLRDADVPQRFEFDDVDLVVNIRAATGGEEGCLHWVWTDDIDWKPAVRMNMSAQTAIKYFQGKENVPIAVARGRIKTGGDFKKALALIPITKPIYARFRSVVEAEYPHLRPDGRAAPPPPLTVSESELTTADVARHAQTTASTLKRWIRDGLIPQYSGSWTPPAIAHARLVARLRKRGHSLDEIRAAGESGRLAFGYLEQLFPLREAKYTIAQAAAETGLEPELIRRIFTTMGLPSAVVAQISEEDLELLRYSAAALAAGLPLIAFLQILRVYGHALAQIADAEVRLFHLYVHEPLMRQGVPGLVMAEEMEAQARELLPLTLPVMENVHQRLLAHFIDQDVIGHMESDIGVRVSPGLGRLRVTILFADLAGYTRLTEEEGDEQAVDAVERFFENVEHTIPDEARIVKTIGDEVMVVGPDAAALVDWAVGFQALHAERPLPRIGMHYGEVLYRDGDYYGREVNQAARVVARAAGGEVLVTRQIVEAAGAHLQFELIGEVRLKGFSEATELYLARPRQSG